MTEKDFCIKLLEINGWLFSHSDDYKSYHKKGYSGIDIDDNEIVLIGDIGDYCHLPINRYALLGALIQFRQLTPCYRWPEKRNGDD